MPLMIMNSTVCLVANKWIHVPSVINIDIRRNTSCFFLESYIAALIFITNNVWHIIIFISLYSKA